MKSLASLKVPIFVALDVDSDREALAIADGVHEFVGGFKVGPRLGFRYGAPLIQELARRGSVFVDNKYLDIPSTMEAAVRASFAAGASFVTIHASAGSEALRRMSEVEAELAEERPFRLLAVTVLTSFSQSTLPPNQNSTPISQQVLQLAELATSCGLTGLVCSAEEVENLRAKFPKTYLVTPGIRFSDNVANDQKRIVGPREALENGSSALVIGRPICDAKDKPSAAKRFYEEAKKVQPR